MKKYRKPFNDDNENHTLRLMDYATGEISGSNPFCDKKEREHIREHAKNRLDGVLDPKNEKTQNEPNLEIAQAFANQ